MFLRVSKNLYIPGELWYIVIVFGTIRKSSKIAMPLDSTAECAEPRRGLKTVSKLYALRVLRGDKSLDFQTVPSCSKIFDLTRGIL